MNSVIEEWIRKAEGDLRVAVREAAVTENPNHDAVCFHCQQCIEKLMKAALLFRNITPRRIHDLAVLDTELRAVVPSWNWPRDELRFLSAAAVLFRYPGESADSDDAARAVDICRRMRTALLPIIDSA